MNADLEEIKKYCRVTDDGHWIWKRYIARQTGYPQMTVRGKTRYVHRISWELRFGPLGPDQWLYHTCEFKSCVNPDHVIAKSIHEKPVEAETRRLKVRRLERMLKEAYQPMKCGHVRANALGLMCRVCEEIKKLTGSF